MSRFAIRNTRRIAIFFSLAPMLFFSDACRKKGSIAKADSSAVQILGLDHGLVGYPGQNPEKTKAYLQSLHFVTDSMINGPVACLAGDDCGGADSVNLRILPEANAHRVDIPSAFAPGTIGGFIMAMVVNTDASHTFGPLALSPGDTAYLWAGATRNVGKLFGFYRISGATGQAQGVAHAAYGASCPTTTAVPRTIPAVHIPMHPCQNTLTPLYGNAQNVNGGERQNPNSLYKMASNPIFAATMLHTQGLWISCSEGCCQVGAISVNSF